MKNLKNYLKASAFFFGLITLLVACLWIVPATHYLLFEPKVEVGQLWRSTNSTPFTDGHVDIIIEIKDGWLRYVNTKYYKPADKKNNELFSWVERVSNFTMFRELIKSN